jgi:hypothetical protein
VVSPLLTLVVKERGMKASGVLRRGARLARTALGSAVAVAVLCLVLGTLAPTEAATVRGTAQGLDAMDAAGATAVDQMRTGSGKSLAVVCAGVSGLLLLGGYLYPAALGFGGSIGSVFLQNATAGAYDAAPAATGVLDMVLPWVRTMEGFAGNRLMHDPVFYVVLGLTFGAVWATSRQPARVVRSV